MAGIIGHELLLRELESSGVVGAEGLLDDIVDEPAAANPTLSLNRGGGAFQRDGGGDVSRSFFGPFLIFFYHLVIHGEPGKGLRGGG